MILVEIAYDELVASLDKVLSHRAPHDTKSNESNLHLFFLRYFISVFIQYFDKSLYLSFR